MPNASGSITSGGVAQDAVPEQRIRWFRLMNTGSVPLYWRDDGGDASVSDGKSFQLPPMAMYETPLWFQQIISSNKISVASSVAGSTFVLVWG